MFWCVTNPKSYLMRQGHLSDARQPVIGLFALFGRDFEQILGQSLTIRVKTVSRTYFVVSRYIKWGKGSLPVDLRRTKTCLLKLPNVNAFRSSDLQRTRILGTKA